MSGAGTTGIEPNRATISSFQAKRANANKRVAVFFRPSKAREERRLGQAKKKKKRAINTSRQKNRGKGPAKKMITEEKAQSVPKDLKYKKAGATATRRRRKKVFSAIKREKDPEDFGLGEKKPPTQPWTKNNRIERKKPTCAIFWAHAQRKKETLAAREKSHRTTTA